MNFEEAHSYLLSLGNEVSAMKLGLESMTRLLNALGDPQNNYLKVQVAGTNGKGSVCSFLEAICVEAGIKVGVTTSPHLISMTERVRVDGENISEDKFAELATRVRLTAEQLVTSGELETVPTYFEQVTAIALLEFAEAEVTVAILETGLGGRLDAATAANAEIAVITRIDLDHQQYLGETIEEIAAEKAAIIHDRAAVVIGAQEPAALKVVLDKCREMNIIPSSANKRYIWEMKVTGEQYVHEFDAEPPTDLGVMPGLKGRHQVENAYTAVMAAASLANDFDLEISEEQIRAGIEKARHPGRLEFRGEYLFDGAHNIGGASALRAYLDEFVDEPITMIFGAMKDKNVREIAEILFPVAHTLILTQPNNERAMNVDELQAIAGQYTGRLDIVRTTTVAEALARAKKAAKKRGLILITGSLYLVGETKTILGKPVPSRE